ncbi:DUF4064 domain-containing protein [Amphibacillus xylanus]|uniref:DUF4064 domain-containing protein n=1 Tax=Amphibacillus xylanus (strain ATCC 51415 / DSM 6626 / JCM 7361 / LMG 17667 / NBRC 15112 / Ep01) TaxID=698758 RepID=K0J606_AMPXN|nr:DUF4064 domain-containing protein [Amphibacillus xylanus]BAM46443.1 hypothetical protein AXY_03110 [Amphibacillus xylanus NBRC 15112]
MLNRRIEIFLIIMGMAIFFFFGISGVTMINVHGDDEAALEIYEQFMQEEAAELENVPTYDEFVETLRTAGVITLVLAEAAGIVSILLLKNDKRPKVAGVLLLIVGIFVSSLQFIIALVGSVFFIIAAMMALFRKRKLA